MSARSVTVAIIILGVALSVVTPRAAANDDSARTTVASKRHRDSAVLLSAMSDKLHAGENSICVDFQGASDRFPNVDQVIAIEFRLLVGRMEGRPIRAEMSPRGSNQYCGTINLGRQFYNPANYYVFVRYTDALGKKRAIRLFASVKE